MQGLLKLDHHSEFRLAGGIGFFAAIMIALLLLAPPSLQSQTQDVKNPVAGDPKEIEQGAFLFRSNCALCHGLAARGGSRGPDLTRGVWNHGGSDAAIFNTILHGLPGTLMPANDLTDLETWQVVAYLRTVAPAAGAPVAGNLAEGQKIFSGDGNCSLCHMVGGKGGRVGPDLTTVGSRRSPIFLAEKIRDPNKHLSPGPLDPAREWPLDAEAVTVVTKDGKTIRGVLRNEDSFSIQLMDLDEQLQLLQKKDLREITHEGKSLMPEYNEDLLNPDQLRDLVAYLDSLRGSPAEQKKP